MADASARLKLSARIYGSFVLVFIISVLVIVFFGSETTVGKLFSYTSWVSAAGLLVQTLRDWQQFDRSMFQLAVQNGFSLGANSHMANVAFDKHVEFSEAYAAEVVNTLHTLFVNGPTKKALTNAGNLHGLREKYVVWLNKDIDIVLGRFEAELGKLGPGAGFAEATVVGDDRQKAIAKMYQRFANLLGQEHMGADNWEGVKLSEDEAIGKVLDQLRVLLGTEELTRLRGALIKQAIGGP